MDRGQAIGLDDDRRARGSAGPVLGQGIVEGGASDIVRFFDSSRDTIFKDQGTYGIDLVCYEAGQHLVGIWGANDREELNAICLEANASERGRAQNRRVEIVFSDEKGQLGAAR